MKKLVETGINPQELTSFFITKIQPDFCLKLVENSMLFKHSNGESFSLMGFIKAGKLVAVEVI